jgi:hypothetical protein
MGKFDGDGGHYKAWIFDFLGATDRVDASLMAELRNLSKTIDLNDKWNAEEGETVNKATHRKYRGELLEIYAQAHKEKRRTLPAGMRRQNMGDGYKALVLLSLRFAPKGAAFDVTKV